MIRFLDGKVTLHAGDCIDVLAGLPANSVDSVVTDPPYHLTSIVKRFGKSNLVRDDSNLMQSAGGGSSPYQRASSGFMGKVWDGGDIAFQPATWAAVLRVLKPGGHMVAFSGTRTYHRMAVAIEDAGFEIRDQLAWMYGSGFPKSHDVSKGIDKAAGAVRDKIRIKHSSQSLMTKDGQNERPWQEAAKLAGYHELDGDTPATDAAREWQGWGTALKPAWEPICLARKPLIGTVAANVLEWGTGAINVDGCRVEGEEDLSRDNGGKDVLSWGGTYGAGENVAAKRKRDGLAPLGRWPANIIHDGSDEVLAGFPETTSGSGDRRSAKDLGIYGAYAAGDSPREFNGDSGSAARFFYTSKADAYDRIIRNVEEVEIEWTSESGLCRVKLQADTELSLEKAIVVSASTDANGWNTFLSGNALTELFQKATSCIISTRTSSTTKSRIWNLLTRSLTSVCMVDVSCATVNGGSHAESAASGVQSITITLGETVSLPGASHALSQTQLKLSVSERRHSHPTCKPLDLMQYLCRLITPPGGTVLDPFAGTGTTGEAAWREGFKAILIEREAEYQADIARRMELAVLPTKRAAVAKTKNNLMGAEGTPLFGGAA